MGLPLSHTPELKPQGKVGASVGLHQVTKVMSVASVTPENIIGVACIRTVGLHLMIGLRLLFPGLNLVHGHCFKLLPLLFCFGKLVEITPVTLLRQREPIHHIAGVVNLEEWLELIVDGILHVGVEREVQRFACYRSELVGNLLDIVVDDMVVHNAKIIKGKDDVPRLTMPSYKAKDGNHTSIWIPATKEAYAEFNDKAINEFNTEYSYRKISDSDAAKLEQAGIKVQIHQNAQGENIAKIHPNDVGKVNQVIATPTNTFHK